MVRALSGWRTGNTALEQLMRGKSINCDERGNDLMAHYRLCRANGDDLGAIMVP